MSSFAHKADQLRTQVAGVMKSAKLPKPNITKKEREALVELSKEKSLMILPADEGKVTAIMDTGEYEYKVKTMLSDDKTYEKLNKDPTPKYKRKLVYIMKKLKRRSRSQMNSTNTCTLQQRMYQECIVIPKSTSQTTLLDR